MNQPLPNSLAFQTEDEDVLNLMGLFHSLWSRKWIILALSIVVAVLTGLWVGTQPAIYQARATLILEQGESSVVSIEDVYSQGYRGWEYMQTQFEMLRSRALAERVVRKLELNKIERFEPQPPPTQAMV